MDVPAYNRLAWDREVESGNPWTHPVSLEEIQQARQGYWQILLTPATPVPKAWLGDVRGRDILCLASGGGQQGPILAAAGANVTVLDNSPKQLEQDELVAKRDGLTLRLELGQMDNLSLFPNGHFDLVVHPVSNLFVADIRPVWREAYRVLRQGGALLSGFCNPAQYMFGCQEVGDDNSIALRYSLPYSDLASLSPEELDSCLRKGQPLEFSHSLDEQIGGQIEAGFKIAGFYEDRWPDHPLDKYFPTFMATYSVK
ncbi:MAG TPA: class I SAM-dependent methyltransferase [Anaerolineaceae bacterium]|nr:class I SAM-dependent methyltransferase [Anaerolineaceae bacterium]